MDNILNGNLSTEYLRKISKEVVDSGLCRKTPLLKNAQFCMPNESEMDAEKFARGINRCNLFFKMENMQIGGCFKMRGVANQVSKFAKLIEERRKNAKPELLTFSGGNYGKCFSVMARKFGFEGTVVMPDTAPKDRMDLIRSNGCTVKVVATKDLIDTVTELSTRKQYHYLDPFDDYDLIAAYSGIGFEILEEVPEPDVVLVACGGGGLLSGVAAGIRSGMGQKNDAKIYGVEPITSNVMYRSFEEHCPVTLPDVKSIAAGLCSPYAGQITYKVCSELVNSILLVEDFEIVEAVKLLYTQMAVIVEPAGAAPLAALLFGKVPVKDLAGKNIVVVISGRNITTDDLETMLYG